MEELKTPQEWLSEKEPGVVILDPDGWRYDCTPIEKPLTFDEFQRRLGMSTVKGRRAKR